MVSIFSTLFGAAVGARNALYSRGVFRPAAWSGR